MKSSIKIDLGPSIRVKVVSTEDVRDRLFQQFLEELDHSSNLLYVHHEGIIHSTDGPSCKEISIYPISDGGEMGSRQFSEKAYFDRMEICPAQCARLIPLCYSQLDPVQAKEVAEKVFDITFNNKAMETLHHVEGIYYGFCATSGIAELTMNCDGATLWFSLPTYQGGSGLSTRALDRKDLEQLSSPDLAKLILKELNKLRNGYNS